MCFDFDMRIGIFFGGSSLEREVSFAGGRTVFDNLDKKLFKPVPVFVDSTGNFILLDWQYIYKGSIRDFYPPLQTAEDIPYYVESLGTISEEQYRELASKVGKLIYPHEFARYFDFAFLALHGPQGEDGSIQGLLEWYGIPYSGSGIYPSSFGIDKSLQKVQFSNSGYKQPKFLILDKKSFLDRNFDKDAFSKKVVREIGFPVVVKPSRQGSSVGVSVVKSPDLLNEALEKAFFLDTVTYADWSSFSEKQKQYYVAQRVDVRTGFGMPVENINTGEIIYHPRFLIQYLDNSLSEMCPKITFQPVNHENCVIIEKFIHGQEFSCIVVEDAEGNPVALPPTQIIKAEEFFDYRSKYLPGMAHKITPIRVSDELVEAVCKACEKIFRDFGFEVYARIDGFLADNGDIFLNDPNTTSGMMPSSFFFHQAAEIGLNPTQFITYIIRTSLLVRMRSAKNTPKIRVLISDLDNNLSEMISARTKKIRIGVIMGGYSSERHISLESGRNVYEKLFSSAKYDPVPIFLSGDIDNLHMHIIPINYLLKDNADDVAQKVNQQELDNKILEKIKEKSKSITAYYANRAIFSPVRITFEDLKNLVDKVFIALHGRPGEDGYLQSILEKYSIPYNGSGPKSASITIDKFKTNEILKRNGIKVAKHKMAFKCDWLKDRAAFFSQIESEFSYPFIAKPYDDGCSTGVRKINNLEQLISYSRLIFRENSLLDENAAKILGLKPNEEFPSKDAFLVEELISKGDAEHFLEITGGFLVRIRDGKKEFEMFEPSEVLVSQDILSLEEKFLAGEGQNITPARYSADPVRQNQISKTVKNTLQRAAEILEIEGYARIDAFVKIYPDDVEIYIIEVNSLPGMTPATVIFHQAALAGYTPYEFIDQILTYTRQ